MSTLLKVVVGLALVPGGAMAQLAGAAAAVASGVQNVDVSLLCGFNHIKPQAIEGTGVSLYGHIGADCFSEAVGYQVARPWGFGLWIELAPEYYVGGSSHGSIPGSASSEMKVHSLGLRFAVPLESRITPYAVAGGGGGAFYYPTILPGSNPYILSNETFHGVFDFGGGVDVRLSRRVSIRGEVRDFVTGHGLSGVSGTNHLLPLFGVAFHF